MLIEYTSIEGPLTNETLSALADVSRCIFENSDASTDWFRSELIGRQNLLTLLALKGDIIVGFKIGFRQRQNYFESWQGGVTKEVRRLGVATELMNRQISWCQKSGFRMIETITENTNVPMLILNMRNGFFVVGSFFDRKKSLKLTLQRQVEN